MLFDLIPAVILSTCQLITLSGGDASLVSTSKLEKASGQLIPDPACSWHLRKDPYGAGGGFQGRDQTQGADGRVKVCLQSQLLLRHRAVWSCALGMQRAATAWPEP